MKRDVAEGVTEEQLKSIQGWRRTIMEIAVEEMLHMCLACNLLTAVGGAAHLRRPNLPSSPRAYPPILQTSVGPLLPRNPGDVRVHRKAIGSGGG